MDSISNILDGSDDNADALLSKLLLDSMNAENDGPGLPQAPKLPYNSIVPRPGFCLKTKTESGEKVFVNVCKADNVPEPKDLTDDELIKVLESDDPMDFRVPMSLGEPHAEVDKSGKGCTAYDVIVNSKFIDKMEKSDLFKTFFVTICFEGLNGKFNASISKDWVILKNKKFMGTLTEQNVRKESKPLIMEMDGPGSQQFSTKNPLISEISSTKSSEKLQEVKKSKAPEPKFTILQDPIEGYPEFMVAEIHMPLVTTDGNALQFCTDVIKKSSERISAETKSAGSFSLDIGEDRILLQTRADVYHLDIYLPYNVVQEECGAQFHRTSKILSITMPVQPQR